MISRHAVLNCAILAAGFWLAANVHAQDRENAISLSDLQFIGTHNSYHVQPDQAVFDAMLATGYQESADWPAARLVKALAYTHAPLQQQLDMGIRVLELDLHDDPSGGRFASPGFLKLLEPVTVGKVAAVDPQGELAQPGFKVFHAPDIDVRSRCLRFVRCLETVRDWSRAHPDHLPIFIQLETKEGSRGAIGGKYVPVADLPFDAASWTRLHAEIRSVFGESEILRPKDVQGAFPSVNAAVRAVGWPSLDEARGRVVFLLLDEPAKQDEYAKFVRTAGIEPVLFVARDAHDPLTAWLMRPSPKAKDIPDLVRAGFLVYTRADANMAQAERNDHGRATKALASGAQLVGTDFPIPDPRFDGGYEVSFADGPLKYVRCNPVRRPRGCALDQSSAAR